MAGNTIGKYFTLTSFGESHGSAVGGIIDGAPAGLILSVNEIQDELNRRRPGFSDVSSTRREEDQLELLSGLFQGITTGMPIGFLVRNQDFRSEEYEDIKTLYRPSHADYSWQMKYGIRDYRGGGRSSAREHISRLVGGAVAKQFLRLKDITIQAYTSAIGPVGLEKHYTEVDLPSRLDHTMGCPDRPTDDTMLEIVREAKRENDSVGAVVSCVIKGLPPGVGEPVFDRLQARLAHSMMSINGAKGFEYGEGFRSAAMKGSAHNDPFICENGKIHPQTNHSGGILGGVSTGEDVFFRLALKPVSTIGKEQHTVTTGGKGVSFTASGRHDPCMAPRVLPVVEAMAAMLILDMMIESGHYPVKLERK